MGAGNLAGNRWQGYSHQELFDMLHSGPGGAGAGTAADRWSGLSGALAEIQADIGAGVTASGATWVGAAGDNARGALGPLGDWAQQASSAAEIMRVSTELQGDLLGKARADMPAPIPVADAPAPGGSIVQLVTATRDHEITELAHQVAEQRAYQVMAQYEAATTDNTGTLGEFGQPPNLVLDTAALAAAPRGRAHAPEQARRVARGPAGYRPRSGVPESRTGLGGARATGTTQPGSGGARAASGTARPGEATQSGAARSGDVTQSGAAPAGPGRGAPATPPTGGAGAPATPPTGGAGVAAREPAEPPESVLDAENVFGDQQTFAPPVIGESRPPR